MSSAGIDVAATGEALEQLARGARGRLTLVAPFVKASALGRILSNVDSSVDLRVITRWHLTELIAGVSDLDVWPAVRDRGGSMCLVPTLHSKVFLSEEEVLVGSANVTAAALGWKNRPNDELLTHPLDTEIPLVRNEVERLWGIGSFVDEALYSRFVDQLSTFELAAHVDEVLPDGPPISTAWLPTTRDPADVERFYLRGEHAVTSGTAVTAKRDLLFLDADGGLDHVQLRVHIYFALLQHPVVTELRTMLTARRRFGEVAQFIAEMMGLGRADAAASWQTLMRWLLHFQPDEWEYGKPRHSEILLYVG